VADTEIDLLRSSLDLLALKASSWEPMHGYAIYTLTTAGRAQFRPEAPVWHPHAEAIAVALRRTSAELA
jgi:hypothetical protein